MARSACGFPRKHKIDAARLEVRRDYLDLHPVGQAELLPCAVADQLMARGVEVEIVLPELGDVHQSFHVELVERHEDAEARHRRDRALELLADAIAHVVALEPGGDLARGLVRAAFGLRAVASQLRPVAWVVAAARENRLDGAMDKEVGITPYGRSEVRVVLVGEPEVADVLRAVLRLLQ